MYFVKWTITIADPNDNAKDKKWLLKIMHHSLAAFQKLIIINNTLIDNAEHLNMVMSIYNLIEYCKKY